MREYAYPAKFTADKKDGGFVITFRDIPEAITQGDDIEACLDEAAGAVQAAVEGRMLSGLDIPKSSKAKRGEHLVAVPVQTALKAALYIEMRKTGITRVELAKRLRIDEKEARRMLDPHHATKADRLERALSMLGCGVTVKVA